MIYRLDRRGMIAGRRGVNDALPREKRKQRFMVVSVVNDASQLSKGALEHCGEYIR